MNNSAYFNFGKPDCRVALVFSCPGKDEEIVKKPVAGRTGNNLDKVLFELNQQLPLLFQSTYRYDYRITNATTTPLYYKRDKRTEGTEDEISDPQNLARLYEEIKAYEYVLSFGDNAQNAVNQCLQGKEISPIHIHCSYHLSPRRVNFGIKEDKFGTTLQPNAPGNLALRLDVVIAEIVSQFI